MRSLASRHRVDLSGAVLALFAVALCILVVLPIGWLVIFAFSDRSGRFTLGNFRALFTDPAFVGPLVTTWFSACSRGLFSGAVRPPMAWLGGATALPLG